MYIQNKFRRQYNGKNKLPFIYLRSEKILREIKERGLNLQQLIKEEQERVRTGIYCQLMNVLRNSEKLEHALKLSSILIKEKHLRPWLARIIIAEMLWGNCHLTLECKEYKQIFAYKSNLEEALKSFSGEEKDLMENKVAMCCTMRCNTHKISMNDLVQKFAADGFNLVETDTDYSKFLSTAGSLKDKQFMVDYHAKDLLLFPNTVNMRKNPLQIDGSITSHLKMNCLAAHLLAPPKGSTVLDFCSFPGKSSIHLAALVGKKGKVYSFDRHPDRYTKLCVLINEAGINNIKCVNKNVCHIEDEYPAAEYIFVEPDSTFDGLQSKYLEKYTRSQEPILRHALTKFPNVKRVVYLTRSCMDSENEGVVKKVIESVKDYKLVNLQETFKGKWLNFGSPNFGEIGTRCVYSTPESDFITKGFIAVFERVSNKEQNEFFKAEVVVPDKVKVTVEENKNSENDEEKSDSDDAPNDEKESENDDSENDDSENDDSENDDSENDEEEIENDSENDEDAERNDDSDEEELVNDSVNDLVKKSKKNKQTKQNGDTNIMKSPKMKTPKKQQTENVNTPKKGKTPKKQQNTPGNKNQQTSMENSLANKNNVKTPKGGKFSKGQQNKNEDLTVTPTNQNKKNTPKNKQKTPNKNVENNSPKRKQSIQGTDNIQSGSAKKKQKMVA